MTMPTRKTALHAKPQTSLIRRRHADRIPHDQTQRHGECDLADRAVHVLGHFIGDQGDQERQPASRQHRGNPRQRIVHRAAERCRAPQASPEAQKRPAHPPGCRAKKATVHSKSADIQSSDYNLGSTRLLGSPLPVLRERARVRALLLRCHATLLRRPQNSTKYLGVSPRNTAATSRQTLATTRFCPSTVKAATCGVKITFSISFKADAEGGSVSRTSSASAPADLFYPATPRSKPLHPPLRRAKY